MALGAPARLLVAGAVGAVLLLGALNPAAAAASPVAQDQGRAHSSYFVQHEAAVAPNAAKPTRSHRLALAGAFLVAAVAATLAARRVGSRDRRTVRRRVEQFHIRLRGPPHLLVAHVTH
ncbi:MAG: hypothetical protein JWM72_2775 [Actinomycetia bacterium]|nr:hypothetical protein [Actinomycetes bacterium]